MVEDNGITKEIEDEIHSVLCKLEDSLFLLRDGKQILANNKLLGIRQKIFVIYKNIKKYNERNSHI